MKEVILAWSAPEFEHHEKTVGWYWMSIIFSLLLLGAAFWMKNFLFGFFVIAAEILILVWANKQPRMIDFSIKPKGLTVDGAKFYPYAEIQSFSIDDEMEGPWRSVTIEFRKKMRSTLAITIPDELAPRFREILRPVIQEVHFERSLIEAIQRILGF
jgi:hypothetical protein